MKAPTTTNQLKNKQLASFASYLAEQRLKQTRSVMRVAKNLGISTEQLRGLEAWDESQLPPVAYRVGLLNKYAALLSVEPIRPRRHERPRITLRMPHSHRQVVLSRILIGGLVVIVGAVLLTYIASIGRGLVAHPKLVLQNPSNDQVVTGNRIEVRGEVSSETIVQINGEAVSVDERSQFRTTIYLRHGDNPVQVAAINSLGHRTEVTRHLYY